MSSPGRWHWEPGMPQPDWDAWPDAELLALSRSLMGPDSLARLEELEAEALATKRKAKGGRRSREARLADELASALSRAARLAGRLGPLWGLAGRLALAAREAARKARQGHSPRPSKRDEKPGQLLLWEAA